MAEKQKSGSTSLNKRLSSSSNSEIESNSNIQDLKMIIKKQNETISLMKSKEEELTKQLDKIKSDDKIVINNLNEQIAKYQLELEKRNNEYKKMQEKFKKSQQQRNQLLEISKKQDLKLKEFVTRINRKARRGGKRLNSVPAQPKENSSTLRLTPVNNLPPKGNTSKLSLKPQTSPSNFQNMQNELKEKDEQIEKLMKQLEDYKNLEDEIKAIKTETETFKKSLSKLLNKGKQ